MDYINRLLHRPTTPSFTLANPVIESGNDTTAAKETGQEVNVQFNREFVDVGPASFSSVPESISSASSFQSLASTLSSKSSSGICVDSVPDSPQKEVDTSYVNRDIIGLDDLVQACSNIRIADPEQNQVQDDEKSEKLHSSQDLSLNQTFTSATDDILYTDSKFFDSSETQDSSRTENSGYLEAKVSPGKDNLFNGIEDSGSSNATTDAKQQSDYFELSEPVPDIQEQSTLSKESSLVGSTVDADTSCEKLHALLNAIPSELPSTDSVLKEPSLPEISCSSSLPIDENVGEERAERYIENVEESTETRAENVTELLNSVSVSVSASTPEFVHESTTQFSADSAYRSVQESVPELISEPNAINRSSNESVHDSIFEAIPETITTSLVKSNTISATIPDTIPECLTKSVDDNVPALQSISTSISEIVPKSTPEFKEQVNVKPVFPISSTSVEELFAKLILAKPILSSVSESVVIPSIEPLVVPVREPAVTPASLPISVPVPESTVVVSPKPVAVSAPESIAVSTTESIGVPVVGLVTVSPLEPVAISASEPVVVSVPEPVASSAPEPAVISVPEQVASSAPEPVVISVPEPVASPAPEPVAVSAPEPVPLLAPETVAVSASEPVVVLVPEPAETPLLDPIAVPIVESTVVPASVSTPVSGLEPIAVTAPAPITKAASEQIPETLTKNAPEPVCQPIAESVAKRSILENSPVPPQPESISGFALETDVSIVKTDTLGEQTAKEKLAQLEAQQGDVLIPEIPDLDDTLTDLPESLIIPPDLDQYIAFKPQQQSTGLSSDIDFDKIRLAAKEVANKFQNSSFTVSEEPDQFFSATSELFEDPASFDYLLERGNNKPCPRNLRLDSLYVRFDPLVSNVSMLPKGNIQALVEEQNGKGDTSTEVIDTPRKSSALAAIDRLQASVLYSPPVARTPQKPEVVQPKAEPVEEPVNETAPLVEVNLVKEVEQVRIVVLQLEQELDIQKKEYEDKLEKQKIAYEEEISRLQAQLAQEVKNSSQMTVVVDEYEKSISRLVADRERDRVKMEKEKAKLQEDLQTTNSHLSHAEEAFNDVHQKYERLKTILAGFQNNEIVLKQSIQDNQETIKKLESRYEQLKNHAMTQLEKANLELEGSRKQNEAETVRLQAMVKKAELKSNSLSELVEQKTKENKELAKILDEVIARVGGPNTV
ncbi:flocculation protein FLO11 isoform X2 [Cephus cinctus]|uniref:Flocculation protein FLO11 isoform X2 n=1 Tax=Cephus cinctus TaxID=211228 RepID=A0AAJ7BYL1_CEPCN|nr:flocculation protein FLO11 isoform X2 [Cephus cinctus]